MKFRKVKPLNLNVFRNKLDEIDEELVKLLVKRLNVSKEIAVYKSQQDIAVRDKGREKEIISNRIKDIEDIDISNEVEEVLQSILASSRSIQTKTIEKINSIDSNLKDSGKREEE